jgi:hypothetical protein
VGPAPTSNGASWASAPTSRRRVNWARLSGAAVAGAGLGAGAGGALGGVTDARVAMGALGVADTRVGMGALGGDVIVTGIALASTARIPADVGRRRGPLDGDSEAAAATAAATPSTDATGARASSTASC